MLLKRVLILVFFSCEVMLEKFPNFNGISVVVVLVCSAHRCCETEAGEIQ